MKIANFVSSESREREGAFLAPEKNQVGCVGCVEILDIDEN
jgi:hypothetical protein